MNIAKSVFEYSNPLKLLHFEVEKTLNVPTTDYNNLKKINWAHGGLEPPTYDRLQSATLYLLS